MSTAAAPIDTQKWHARIASCRAWLCGLMLWLADWFGDSDLSRHFRLAAARDLRRTQQGLRGAIVLLALARVDWSTVPGARTWRPSAFVRHRCAADLRHVARRVPLGAPTLHGRLARIIAVIDDLDAWIARIVTRLEAGFRQLAPLAIAALWAHEAQWQNAPGAADTS